MDYLVPLLLSLIAIILFSSFIICVITTGMPFFVNKSNADEILPITLKATKLNTGMIVVSVILVVLAKDTLIGNSPLLKVSISFLAWSIATMFLVNMRKKMLAKNTD